MKHHGKGVVLMKEEEASQEMKPDRLRRVTRSGLGLVMALTGVLVFATGQSRALEGSDAQSVVLRINGQPVYADELEVAIDSFLPSTTYHGGGSSEVREKYRDRALERLIDHELLFQAASRDKIQVEDDRLDEAVEQFALRYGRRGNFDQFLRERGLDMGAFRTRLRKDMMAEVYVKREIMDKVPYSEAELRDYYSQNQESFRRPPSAHLWHIILKVPANARPEDREERRAEAEYIAQRARNGEDFSHLAEKYSEDEYRVVGGKLGLVHQGMLMPALESAALGLDAGEIAGPIETIYGYHILKSGGRVEGQLVPFEEIRDKLREDLEKKRLETLKAQVIARLKDKAVIEVLK